MGFELERLFGLTMGLSLLNISLYFLLLIWGFTLKTRDVIFQKNNVNRYLFILTMIIGVSIFLNIDRSGIQPTSLKDEIVSYKEFLNPWLLFLLITSLIRDKRNCDRILSALIVFFIVTVFAVLIQNFLGINLGTHIKAHAYIGRSAGFSEANQYAAYLVLFLPLFLSSMFFQEEKSKKIKGFFLFFIGLLALVFTISKGGFISFFISMGYFVFLAYKYKLISMQRVFVLSVSVVVLLAASYFILPSHTEERIKARVEFENTPYNPYEIEHSWIWKLTSGRTQIWAYSLELIVQKPIFGYGIDNASIHLERGTHNEYLGWLVKYGIIGFLLFCIIYLQIYRYVIHYLKTSAFSKNQILCFGYICGFIGYVVAMFGLNLNEPRYIFWIYTAIIYKYTELDAIEKSESALQTSFSARQIDTARLGFHGESMMR